MFAQTYGNLDHAQLSLAKRWFAAQIRLINKLLKEAPLNITSRYNE